eukprot:530678_1
MSMEVNESHEILLKNIDSFNHTLSFESENNITSISEKEDIFKEEINSLNNSIAKSQCKLSSLTAKYMIQQKHEAKNEEKINQIKHKINKLNDIKNVILPNKLNEIETDQNIKLKDLHLKKLKLKELIIKNENKIKNLLYQCKLFETNFGINCYVIPNTENAKISFSQINKHNINVEYSVTVTLMNNKFKIVKLENCDNDDEIIKYLENKLNSTQPNAFSKFIKLVRKYFVLIVDQQYIART